MQTVNCVFCLKLHCLVNQYFFPLVFLGLIVALDKNSSEPLRFSGSLYIPKKKKIKINSYRTLK